MVLPAGRCPPEMGGGGDAESDDEKIHTMSLAYGRCDAIAAPAWRRACQSLSLRSELISGVAFVCVGVLFSRACVTAAVYLPRIRSLRDREWLWPRFDCSSRAERDREARVWLLMPACSVQWRWSHDDTNPAPLPISTSMSRNPSGLLMASCCALPPSVVLRLCGPLFLCVVAYVPSSPLLRCCIVSRTLCASFSLSRCLADLLRGRGATMRARARSSSYHVEPYFPSSRTVVQLDREPKRPFPPPRAAT